MESTATIERRLTDLEIKASFGEDLLDQLNCDRRAETVLILPV